MPLAAIGALALEYSPPVPGATRVVYDGEVAEQDSRWTPLFEGRAATSLTLNTTRYPPGTVLTLRIRARDTSDDAASEWSEPRTVVVQHPE